jgi:hypothetical protein
MGQEIVYCSRCQSRLTGANFDDGSAVRLSNYIYCAGCLTPVEKEILEKLRKPAEPPPSTRRSTTLKAVTSSSSAHSAVPKGPAGPRPTSRRPLLFAAAGAAVVLVLIVVVLISRGGTDKAPPPEPERAPAPAARIPDPIRPWEFAHEFDSIKAEFQAPVSQRNFKVAQEVLERARSLHADARWAQGLADLDRELNAQVRARFKDLTLAAGRARERKAIDEIRDARLEVDQWGPAYQALLKEFDDAFGAALAVAPTPAPSPVPPEEPRPPAPKPADPGPVLIPDPQRSEAGRKYLSPWQKAMDIAARGDFDAAAAEIQSAARDFKEEDVRKEIDGDLKDLAQLKTLRSDGLKELSSLPSWTSVAFDVTPEDGTRATVRGQVLQAGPRRLELRGEPRYVELDDIRAGSLAKFILQKKKELPPDGSRLLAMLCALDGDEATLSSIPEGRDLLAPKIRNYCTSHQGKPLAVDADARRTEWAARNLFYQAEVEFRALETRGAALEKYDTLLGAYSSTSFVKANKADIVARKDECRDYGFPALRLKGKGVFALQKLLVMLGKEKLEMVGWKTREEPAADDPNTYVEASFYALPETEYKAWALVGGCCATTFTWFLQASEMTYTDRKTGKTLNCDPGSNFAAPWTLHLPKLSTMHGGKNHAKAEKEPTIWDWVEVPMPRYAAPGVKTIRFMAASKGMALGAVLVTSLKDKRPGVEMTRKFAELSMEDGLPPSMLKAGKGEPDLLTQIPEARPYALVYDLDLARLSKPVKYDADHHAEITRGFDRIAYLLELQKGTEPGQFVFVSMDAFTDDISKVGIPDLSTGARFQQKVGSMNVYSNVEGLTTGVGLDGGNIEFWTNNYGPWNSANVPGASNSVFDFGDQPTEPVDGYGSMQVHNHKTGQTIFALNHWRDGGNGADLGIGNSPGPNPDWTFTHSAGSYSLKRLRVLVRPKA